MDVLITALMIVALIHYVYDRIVLPTLRLKSRSNIFALRDQLRQELITNKESYSPETLRLFKVMDDRINHAVNRLHVFTLINYMKVRMLPEGSLPEVEAFRKRLKECESDVLRDVHVKLSEEVMSVLGANSLLMCLWLLPIVLTISLVGFIIGSMRTLIKETVDDLADIVTGNKDNLNFHA